MKADDKEFTILKSIHEGKETIKQRDIAKIAGISLGSANTIIKRLAEKGLLKASHINSKNIQYLLTPSGINHLTKKSGDFFKHTIKNVVVYKDAIDSIIKGIKEQGYTGVIVDKESDFNFLIEYSCYKHNLDFNQKIENSKRLTDEYILRGLL